MFVCVCSAVREKEVDRAIDQGAVTVDMLMEQLSVGTSCGCCVDHLQERIDQRLLDGLPEAKARDVWPGSGSITHTI